MEQKQSGEMGYNERLLSEALGGNKDSFKELKFNAGAGDMFAQYYFAQYYLKVSGSEQDGDYLYWMRKASSNGYKSGLRERVKFDNEEVEEGMTFSEAVKICFLKYATFSGRASRAEYWWFAWFYFLVIMFLVLISIFFANSKSAAAIILMIYAVSLFSLILPAFAVSVRRLHDIGKSGWWLLVSMIPFLGPLILLYFVCKKSGPDNEYGEVPEK